MARPAWFVGPWDPDRRLACVPPEPGAGTVVLVESVAMVDRPRTFARRRTVVIGGGIAGALCARTLHDHGEEVIVLDKGRGPGGRLSTRRGEGVSWDHGCPSFTARTGLLRGSLRAWAEEGLVAPWEGLHGALREGQFTPSTAPAPWVGVPGMSAVVRHLLADVPAQFATRVVSVTGGAGGWAVALETGETVHADRVVVATPAAQAVPLLPPSLAAEVGRVVHAPVWVALLRFATAVDLPWESAQVDDPVLAWAGRQRQKPGRSRAEAWVLHATGTWSEAHREDRPEEVVAALVDGLARCAGVVQAPAEAAAHRWLYGRISAGLEAGAVWDGALGIGWCGEGAGGEGMEAAFLSGAAMAGRLLDLGQPASTR